MGNYRSQNGFALADRDNSNSWPQKMYSYNLSDIPSTTNNNLNKSGPIQVGHKRLNKLN